MQVDCRLLVTEVYEGRSRVYVSGLDLDNGGAVRFSLPLGQAPEFPIMVPLELSAEVYGRRYQNNFDLQVRRLHVDRATWDGGAEE